MDEVYEYYVTDDGDTVCAECKRCPPTSGPKYQITQRVMSRVDEGLRCIQCDDRIEPME